jgi:hypothetical protein
MNRFGKVILNWDAKQYSRIWCLSIVYRYILYLEQLTALIRRPGLIFHKLRLMRF